MDNVDEEPTYQYFTIKNDADPENIVGIHDILDLPNEPEEQNQVFYLTFNGDEENRDESLVQMENADSNGPLPMNSDIKLITLGDGQMFMTTDDNLDSMESPLIIGSGETSTAASTEDNTMDLIDRAQLSTEEESVDGSGDFNYQLIQLTDGTQAVIKIYQINEEPPKEEAPKKKKFQCFYEGCNKFYATSYHLTVHMRSHTDSKPYECTMDGCDKKFSTNYSLKAHIRTHTGEKPYSCTMCTKQFKTSGDLQKHVRIHTGEKPFTCPIMGCGKSFTTSNIRKVHIRSHTGERPYSCNYPNCGKAFTSSTNYKNHLRIHSGEKPYVCQVEGCSKRFTEYSSLYKHNAVHQDLRPHICIYCGQRFKQESTLNVHKRLQHNVVVTKDGTEIIINMVD